MEEATKVSMEPEDFTAPGKWGTEQKYNDAGEEGRSQRIITPREKFKRPQNWKSWEITIKITREWEDTEER